ncbi:MAG: hypothetical protein JWQ12_824 [Glaciihabitans sp.]|nr:hypothetical protein [Glaciihabitans sp.]
MSTTAPWWDRLHKALIPRIGPPPLGPYGEAPLPSTAKAECPICGLAMEDHIIERGDGRAPTRLLCP